MLRPLSVFKVGEEPVFSRREQLVFGWRTHQWCQVIRYKLKTCEENKNNETSTNKTVAKKKKKSAKMELTERHFQGQGASA